MSKWVNFSVLIEMMQNKYECLGYVEDVPFEELKNFLNSVPSINIVRCKECKHWTNAEDYDCEIHSGAWDADDFCSYGERIK